MIGLFQWHLVFLRHAYQALQALSKLLYMEHESIVNCQCCPVFIFLYGQKYQHSQRVTKSRQPWHIWTFFLHCIFHWLQVSGVPFSECFSKWLLLSLSLSLSLYLLLVGQVMYPHHYGQSHKVTSL